jgi:hypothetical protein
LAVAFSQFRSGKAGARQFFKGSLGIVALLTLSLLGGMIAMFFAKETLWLAWGTAATAVALGAFKWVESRFAKS